MSEVGSSSNKKKSKKKSGDGSEGSQDSERSVEGKQLIIFEDSENERFKFHSRTKTPFFLVSEPDDRKEGLDLIKEISDELDQITKTIPSARQYIKPQVPSNPPKPDLRTLPKPTKRDLNKDTEKHQSFKIPILSTKSINQTFSFF